MEQFKPFCEAITTSVENRIISWHGRNDITPTQAFKLIQNGYMLGGFIVDIGGSSIIMPGLLSILSMCGGRQRISNQEFKREDESLYNFYRNYELDYDECKNADELNSLQSRITNDLYERSMTAIRLTCAFGG